MLAARVSTMADAKAVRFMANPVELTRQQSNNSSEYQSDWPQKRVLLGGSREPVRKWGQDSKTQESCPHFRTGSEVIAILRRLNLSCASLGVTFSQIVI